MSSELQEVLEFMRDNVPTKAELTEFRQDVRGDITSLREHVDSRFDEIESRLDFRERIGKIEQRLAKLEDEHTGGKFEAQHAG
jgi:hypothetical protein